MRIGYIHVDYEEWTDGSYNVQEIGLAKAFEKLGHETIIVYWVKRNSPKCNTEKRVTEHIKKLYLPAEIVIKHHVIFNCNILKKYNFDLMHIQCDNLFYVPEITSWCQRNKVPYYCYVGTIESSNPVWWQRIIVNLLTKRNIKAYKKSKVFAKTPVMAKQLESLGIGHVSVAPVGLDISIIPEITETKNEIRKRLDLPTDKKIVLCVSALREDRKPMDIFLLADQLGKEYQVVFIGSGPMQEVFDEKRKKYPDMVYIRKVPNNEIHQFYRMADYFVNFNDKEIFGMSILEAMYQGCTVIARHAPGPDFIIINDVNGHLCCIVPEMINFIYLGRNLGVISKKRVLNNFIWDITAKLLLSGEKQ